MVTSESKISNTVKNDLDFKNSKDENENDEEIQIFSNSAKYLFHISKLTKNLYLSGACALRADTFEKLGITCIINCTTREELPDPPLPNMVTTYLRVPVLDSPMTNLFQYFHNTSDTIKKVSLEGGKILVHCIAGVSRSVSICLAYLLKYHEMTLKEAYEYIERRRPCIYPNNSFFRQLIDFEIENRRISSVSIIFDNNIQSYIPDLYQCKFKDKFCCQLKKCQRRHCGMH